MMTFQTYLREILKTSKYHFDKETQQWIGVIPSLPVCWVANKDLESTRTELS